MAQHPSSVSINGPAYYSTPYAANYSTTVLSTVVGRPNHAPQVVEFFNAGTAAENAVYTDINGVSHTRVVAAGQPFVPPVPVASIVDTSGTNVSAKAYWWPTIDHTINPA